MKKYPSQELHLGLNVLLSAWTGIQVMKQFLAVVKIQGEYTLL
jgi:hypothetical protein